MKIIVGGDDRIATKFAEEALAARIISQTDECLTLEVPGGGTRPVILFSCQTGEARKSFSIKIGSCDYPLPGWVERMGGIEGKVILVLNQELYHKASGSASNILGILKRETRPYHVDSSFAGRGGYVAFAKLPPERVLTGPTSKLLAGKPNKAYQDLTGFSSPVVTYGTTDASNVFELLQTLKAASVLGLPAVFDSYDSAHTVGDYFQRVLVPSLILFDSEIQPADLGLDPNAKFWTPIKPYPIQRTFLAAGLRKVAPRAAWLAEASFAHWYREGMTEVAGRVLALLGLQIPFKLISLNDVLQQSEVWSMRASEYTLKLERAGGHPVIALHDQLGNPIKSNIYRLPDQTIGQLHDKGWWLGGAGIYWASYRLGSQGTLVYLLKDSEAGNVHLLARPFMEDEKSGLYVIPVGLFRLHAQGQAEDASIDPWVFIELLERWGEEKAREAVQRIWEAMEVPLKPEHVGRKTVATVSLDGVEIQVQE